MNWNTFTDRQVPIEYANMAKLNKIRAMAKKYGCRVEISRYARDAYEGKVIVPMLKGRDDQQNTVAAITAFIGRGSIAKKEEDTP